VIAPAGIPPVQVLGDAILFRGQALRDLAYLLPRAVTAASRADGISPPRRWLVTLEAVKTATAMSACPVTDVGSEADSREWLTSRETAELLQLSERQVTRLGTRIGGHRARGGWLFSRTNIEEHAQTRNESTT
jgi:hypothetical protein